MNNTYIPKTAKIYLEKWLADHEPFGAWGADKFYRFIGVLKITKKKALGKETLRRELEKVIHRNDKKQIINEAMRRFEIINEFIKANSHLIDSKFKRAYHNYIQKNRNSI